MPRSRLRLLREMAQSGVAETAGSAAVDKHCYRAGDNARQRRWEPLRPRKTVLSMSSSDCLTGCLTLREAGSSSRPFSSRLPTLWCSRRNLYRDGTACLA